MLTPDERTRLTQIEVQAHFGYGAVGGPQDARPWLCALARRLDVECECYTCGQNDTGPRYCINCYSKLEAQNAAT